MKSFKYNQSNNSHYYLGITNICSLSHCVLISNVSSVFKSINLDKFGDFSSFKLRACVSQRTTRVTESNKIEAPIVCQKRGDYCFLPARPASWNNLDNITTSCKNFSTFKNNDFTYISSPLNKLLFFFFINLI